MRLPRLPPLDRKLLRDLWRIRGQALAIALVIAAGVGMFVMSKGMLLSLEQTRSAYYERYHFADLYAPVRRAPQALLARVRELPGVRRAETRVHASALMDVPGMDAPVSAQLLSLPVHDGPAINDILLRLGRMPDPARPNEILLLESFAQAHGLSPGDSLHAVLRGKRRHLKIAGIALSPEFVYAMAPGEIVPDPQRFGVGWMNRDALAAALDLDGAFNELLILSARGARSAPIIQALDQMLAPYGGSGAYGRERQMSDRFLANEIQQLGVMGYLLPPIFLLVAAFLLNVVTARLIETEREQIGLLKAFGYSHAQVATHYLKLSGLITLLGLLIGSLIGHKLGQGLALLYMDYFKFPFLLFDAPLSVYLGAAGISVLAAVAGSMRSTLAVLRLQPAVAMLPATPPDYSRTSRHPGRFTGPPIDQPSRMMLRHLRRWPLRAALTVTGIAMAMGLQIGASFSLDAMDHMIDVSFNLADRQDASLSFVDARHASALQEIRRSPGVLYAEPFRAIPAVLSNGTRRRHEALIGLAPGAELSRLVDSELRPVALPESGLVLSDKLAELLQVRVGQTLHLQITEGRNVQRDVPVSAIVTTYLGTSASMSLAALNRLLSEDGQISGAHLLIDEAQAAPLFRHLKEMPGVAGIRQQDAAQRAFYDTLDESLGTFTFFNTLFATLIVVGVVYNSARVSLSERGRELASLRVLGLTRAEVSWILLGELGLLTLLALPLGAALGYLLAAFMVHSFDTDLFRIPLVVSPATFGYAGLVVVLSALASGLIVRRRIDRLDLVAVLKTRE